MSGKHLGDQLSSPNSLCQKPRTQSCEKHKSHSAVNRHTEQWLQYYTSTSVQDRERTEKTHSARVSRCSLGRLPVSSDDAWRAYWDVSARGRREGKRQTGLMIGKVQAKIQGHETAEHEWNHKEQSLVGDMVAPGIHGGLLPGTLTIPWFVDIFESLI